MWTGEERVPSRHRPPFFNGYRGRPQLSSDGNVRRSELKFPACSQRKPLKELGDGLNMASLLFCRGTVFDNAQLCQLRLGFLTQSWKFSSARDMEIIEFWFQTFQRFQSFQTFGTA
jgi:hypothetical protein